MDAAVTKYFVPHRSIAVDILVLPTLCSASNSVWIASVDPMVNTIVNRRFAVSTSGQGLFDFTHKVAEIVAQAELSEGLVTLFLQHTSASLLIQENADPSAQRDLERWLDRLVPELDPLYTHVAEGPDDMPAHIKAALTATNLSIPVIEGQLALGTWQGIFLWEHRHRGSKRNLVANLQGQMSLGS